MLAPEASAREQADEPQPDWLGIYIEGLQQEVAWNERLMRFFEEGADRYAADYPDQATAVYDELVDASVYWERAHLVPTCVELANALALRDLRAAYEAESEDL